jgi:hypothetical protein
MLGQQPQQLHAGVTGTADDADLDYGKEIKRTSEGIREPLEIQQNDISPQRRKERKAIFFLKNQDIFFASFASLR